MEKRAEKRRRKTKKTNLSEGRERQEKEGENKRRMCNHSRQGGVKHAATGLWSSGNSGVVYSTPSLDSGAAETLE